MLEFCFKELHVCAPAVLHPVDYGCNAEEMICLEIFAGSAQLSSALKSEGFQVLAIDHKVFKEQKARLMTLDLTQQAGVDVLFETLIHANIAYCHAAPVCGTSSMARDKPLPPEMAHINSAPLRSSSKPLGLDSLQGKDQARVHAANLLYFVTVCVAWIANKRGFPYSCENPSNSYFRAAAHSIASQHPELERAWLALEMVRFQSCAHGGQRDKWTGWYSTPGVFSPLRAFCTHVHESSAWRPFMVGTQPHFPQQQKQLIPNFCVTEWLRS